MAKKAEPVLPGTPARSSSPDQPTKIKRRGFFRRGRQQGTSQASTDGRKTSDLTIAALGITLGLICASFPWYIFFNQEKFGIRAMKFGGNDAVLSERMVIGNQPDRVGAPMDVPPMELDLFATGTLRDSDGESATKLPGVDEQPFPVAEPVFRLVHVANGRAMIEDDSGIWVVQRGSTLPDNSTVASIEQRDGSWVLVTSEDRVLETD